MPELKHLVQQLICKLWFRANKLTLNLDKSSFSIFHTPRKKLLIKFNTLNVDGVITDRLHQVKCLGTFLDDKLNWKAHVNYLCQKLNKIQCAFKFIKKKLVPKQHKCQLYCAYHYSQISCGIIADGTAAKSNLIKVQRRYKINLGSFV